MTEIQVEPGKMMSASRDSACFTELAEALFSPRSVALVGASADLTKINSRPQRFLRRHGYSGRIYPVNPRRGEILGETAYPDVRTVPGPIDHAFIMVPAPAVPDVVAQCCERGVKVATIFSAGFAELGGEGIARQRAMVEMARAAGLRLIGPNCMGVINVQGATPLTVNAVIEYEELRPGPLSVISQSGSMLGSLLSRAQAREVGFSKLVSVGNECDLGVGEIADMLVDDPGTGAILLFLETFRDSENLARAARRAYSANKPVIAYKLGRSAVGRQAATSHTGAMVGPDEAANAFFREHGIIRVDMMESLFEAPRLVIGHKPRPGRRAAVLTATGGAAAMIVDRLGVLGIDVVAPPAKVRERLAAKDIHVSEAPLTDLPMGQADGGRYTAVLSELLGSDHCDAVVAVIGSSAHSDPSVIVDRVISADHGRNKPVAVFLAPRADEGLIFLEKHGVAGFRTPESCADAVSAFLKWRAPAPVQRVTESEMMDARALASRMRGRRLNELESCMLFAALGISVAKSRVIADAQVRPDMEGPVALKILSADIPHKTDAGLVRLNVPLPEAPKVAKSLLDEARKQYPQAKIDGILVQRMEEGIAEIIVGYRRDAEVGPVVMMGAGGTAAELKREFSVRLAPVTVEEADAMISEVPALALLRGYRNVPRGDCMALARTIRALSLLALLDQPAVSEAEINPVIVKKEGQGVVAVDGIVAFHE